MLLENYAGHLRELAHRHGLRLSIQAYDGICDDLRYAGRADETMCEFWQRGCYTGLPLCDIVEEMASAAHVYGHRILSAEAFTAWRGDFLDHPATLKPLGDWAFCAGVNHFVFNGWVAQPWPERVPGVGWMFGTQFHRTLTWWEQSKAWHDYVARCQHMLRQGQFVADVCFLRPRAPRTVSWRPFPRPSAARSPIGRSTTSTAAPGTRARRHESPRRPPRLALGHELSPAGPADLRRRWPAGHAHPRQLCLHRQPLAEGPDHDPALAAADQGACRGRRDCAGPQALEVAQPGRLPRVRQGTDSAGR